MAVSSTLTGELKKVVLTLEDDLRERVQSQPEVLEAWQAEHRSAFARERTAMSWQEWRDDRVTQAAVAWVLTTVFIRFCEDNRLLKPVWFAGPAQRRQEALDAELAYFRANPEHTDREWILTAVEHLRQVRATADLVESHSPLWTVSPSGPAARELVHFWRAKGDDGALLRDFTDPELSTRFLGDLYQDLSDYAKKTYALLQTPEFVEEFILDQTMEPALAERSLDGFTIIDPTCGSGHFLLGAFQRLVDRWADHAPGLNARARVAKALESIHGVDINPFAVAIAKFRLIVAAMQAAEEATLEEAPNFRLSLAAGDSLLHGRAGKTAFAVLDDDADVGGFTYSSEDWELLHSILVPGRYDAVVGNPPYITVKDKTLNKRYRARYDTCKGTYALTIPFMERFFELAKRQHGDHPAGWTGQITSNSFMKREFGSKIIEEFLVDKDLRAVIDTSGAYIPGHGTPTVIIVGRNQRPVGSTLKAVLGVRGEPGQPKDPAQGVVWSEIVNHIAGDPFEGSYVTVTDLDRTALAQHPWSLSGGGASELLAALDNLPGTLDDRISSIGRTTVVGEDEAWFTTPSRAKALNLQDDVRPLVIGENVRDFSLARSQLIWWPYTDVFAPNWLPESHPVPRRVLWSNRTLLSQRVIFGQTLKERNRPWYDHLECYTSKMQTPLSIAFAFVATHNHFVLDRGGKVFKQSAPVIKLPKDATEEDHLALLGVLNSSTACFWLKQNSHDKGNGGYGGGIASKEWERFFEFTGTTLKDFPLPAGLNPHFGRVLDNLAQRLSESTAQVAVTGHTPTIAMLTSAEDALCSLRRQLVAEQEELDWNTYQLFGLIDEDLTYGSDDTPEVALGERAFEIALAREIDSVDGDREWFERHGSTPVTEIPTQWPQAYRDVVQRRLDLIESNKFIRLLEKPEHKRRWAMEPWDKQVESALRGWMLDRLEDRKYWFDASGQRPQPRSVAQLADLVSRDPDFVSVLELWAGTKDQPVVKSLSSLLSTESVPFLAAYRLKEQGLRKREAWEHTWDLQRREDAGERLDTPIPVPPKYTTADFRKQHWWAHRGKLDVPKERFILYPDAGRDTDPTDVLGWAGWNHAQQSLALATLVGERESDGWDDDRLVPLVAGLAELQPWVQQWHDEPDATYGVNLAEFCSEELRDRAAQVGHTLDQLHAWRPAPSTRGRKKKANP